MCAASGNARGVWGKASNNKIAPRANSGALRREEGCKERGIRSLVCCRPLGDTPRPRNINNIRCHWVTTERAPYRRRQVPNATCHPPRRSASDCCVKPSFLAGDANHGATLHSRFQCFLCAYVGFGMSRRSPAVVGARAATSKARWASHGLACTRSPRVAPLTRQEEAITQQYSQRVAGASGPSEPHGLAR